MMLCQRLSSWGNSSLDNLLLVAVAEPDVTIRLCLLIKPVALQRRLKDAINLEQAGAGTVNIGKATLQKGKDKARWVLSLYTVTAPSPDLDYICIKASELRSLRRERNRVVNPDSCSFSQGQRTQLLLLHHRGITVFCSQHHLASLHALQERSHYLYRQHIAVSLHVPAGERPSLCWMRRRTG
jgi:hypothetical protein